MAETRLTFERLEVRPVLVPLNRPVVSRVGIYERWPLILIDLHTREGVVGRSYLAPSLAHAVMTSLARSMANRSPLSTLTRPGARRCTWSAWRA